ncbi:MAG: T9SS type A sorting domain-containing protein [Flavobacteriales bacterium]|nr:T9SS type A sorting domain-containing protein [Flavobacteriales bacterium]
MKTSILFILTVGSTLAVNAQQVEDSIEMLSGYTNESYYSLANDEQLNIDNTNWDLAFDLSGFGSSIRTNEHIGTEVYVYPNGTDWTNVDTTGMNWNSMHNSETTWSVGAFDQSINPSDQFDIGWGVYNMVSHQILGDSIHIVKLSNGDYKKVQIESLISGVYAFRHADLNGANEVSATITKADYTDKNFVYYSITNDAILDREPNNTSWDLVFTKYVSEVAPGMNYGVTGVLSNNGVHIREASGVDPNAANFYDFSVDSVINVIGYDWKSFNMTTFNYDIAPDLSYFVQDQAGDVWHIIFTRFEGSTTGKVVFTKEKVSTASLNEIDDISSFGIYPNPATEHATLIFNSSSNDVNVSITNIEGKVVFSNRIAETGFVTYPISVSEFKAGTYFIQLSTPNGVTIKKLIVQ